MAVMEPVMVVIQELVLMEVLMEVVVHMEVMG
jgi:hypothetical protein